MMHNFSLSSRKTVIPASIFALILASLGTVLSLILEFPPLLAFGMAGAFYFSLVFWRDPLLFLICMIPLRMMLDFPGEFFLIGMVGGSPLSLSQVIGVFVFCIGTVFFVRYSREALRSMRTMAPFWIFFAWSIVSLAFSVSPSDTLRDILRVFDIVALASIAFVFTNSRNDVRRILLSMLCSFFVPAVLGAWQYASGSWYPDEFTELHRIYGTFGHPNVFGMYLFVLIVLAFLFWKFFAEDRRERVSALSIGAAAFILIFLTLSRISWAILLFFFLTMAVLRFRQAIIPTTLLTLSLFLFVPSVQDRIVDLATFSADSSVLWRVNIWKDAVGKVFAEDRAWLGFGLDTFPVVISEMHTSSFGSADAHNDFVKFFVEGGLLGLSAYLLWIGWFALRFWREASNRELSARDRELFLFLSVLFVSLVLASFSDAVFKSTPLQWMFWIFAGALLGLTKKERYARV
jgi:O-antigen ligase